ncbi:MAG: ComF family protein [Synechococcales bacterium]|nr:ComF family protein [Synechococcales bacterium]
MKIWPYRLQSWLNLVFEAQCPLCQRSTAQVLCQDCDRQIQDCRLPKPAQHWGNDVPLFAWGRYGGSLKRAIAALKYHHTPQLGHPMGLWMADAWRRSPVAKERSLLVVPIPMYAEKQRQRGYNQAILLAQGFCNGTGLPLAVEGLVRVRQTEAQFGLSSDERERNLADAFQVSPSLSRRSRRRAVLLLDDIYTTGATVRSAIGELRRQSIPLYGVVTLAQALATTRFPLDS